jgi:hypothetical protein
MVLMVLLSSSDPESKWVLMSSNKVCWNVDLLRFTVRFIVSVFRLLVTIVYSPIFTILSPTASSTNPLSIILSLSSRNSKLSFRLLALFHAIFRVISIKAVKHETKLCSVDNFLWRLSNTKFHLNPLRILEDEIRRWTEIETNMTSLLREKQRNEGKKPRERQNETITEVNIKYAVYKM